MLFVNRKSPRIDTGHNTYVILRDSGETEAMIGIDYRTRQRLGVKSGDSYDFELKPAGILAQPDRSR
jgi:hypothetical protein